MQGANDMKVKCTIKYLLGIALVAMSAVIHAQPQHDEMVVRVGYYHIPGFHNKNVNGELSGYGYDFLQLVRRYSQVEFTYSGYDKSWEESLAMLENGEIDLLTGALRTPERENKFDYSFPIGETRLNLYVRNSDERYRPVEYSTYNGMRIGTVRSEILDERIKRMAARNNFGCTIVGFDDFESMGKALQDGKIDAMCAIGTHLITGFRILDQFDNENIYAIVRKGDTLLLSTLNDAILQMDQSMTMWTLNLFQVNYLVGNAQPLEFSQKEKDFIRQHSTAATAIRIATDDTWKPYSWYEDGRHRGIVVEFVERLMKQAGLSYEFVEGDISNESILESRPEVDIYVDFASTKQYAEEQGLVVSSSFMQPSISIVSKKGYEQLESIGLSRNTPMLNKVVMKNYDYTFTVFSSTEELITAVRNGKVDGAMMYDFVAQLYVNTEEDNKMQISFIPGMTLPLHMVTRKGDGRELISIVSKCIDHIGKNECENIATKYLSAAEEEVGVWDFMKKNPWLPMLVLLLSLSGFLLERYKRIKMELRKQKLLEVNIAANEAKTRFLHNMSHEIRTPLNAMFGFAQLLGMPDGCCTPEEKEQYNAYIYNSYRMLEMLISDIMDVADSEHGNYRIEIDDVRVNEICRSAIQSVEFRVPAGVRLYFTTDAQEDLIVKSDGRRIQQVLINYLTNACKNTHQGEIHLHCSLTEHPGKIAFSVTDTGTGVPKEKADLIFNRFTKLNQFVQGSGLGLNICQTIADKLHGDVFLDTSYTGGARFVFLLGQG